jgi:plasmid segregation protein ParM
MSQFPSLLAVDVGFGNTKAVWGCQAESDDQQAWREICFRSAAPKIGTKEDIPQNKLNRLPINVGGQQYWVGPEAYSTGVESGVIEQSVKNIQTPEYQALIAGAWGYMLRDLRTNMQSIDTLVLGLPISAFKAKRDELVRLGGRVMTVPIDEHIVNRSEKTEVQVMAKKCIVLPQPYGGFVCASAKNLKLASDGSTTLVLDPGYSTLDWFLVENGSPRIEQCDSFEGGMSTLLSELAAKISTDVGCGSPSFGLLEKALLRNEIVLSQRKISMVDYQQTLRKSADVIIAEFLRRFDPEKFGVTDIVLTGGSASYFEKSIAAALPAYPIHTSPNSVMANARGFFLATM